MSAPGEPAQVVGPSTLITVKILYNDNTRRFKVPLRDLNAHVLPQKLHQLLDVPSDAYVTFERYSDSAGCYVELDSDNLAVYKQLHRAAKAKLKLRLRATTVSEPLRPESPARSTYLDSVPTQPTLQTCFDTLVAGDTTAAAAAAAAAPPSPPPSFSNNVAVESMDKDNMISPPEPCYRDFVQSASNLPLAPHQSPTGLFCIDCNYCGRSIPNEHYHCSTCEDGDYDLCLQCVDLGVSCPGEGHWLIKRLVKEGVVTNSTTETIAPREFKPLVIKQEEQPPVQSAPEPTTLYTGEKASSNERVCNACLSDFAEANMVTCMECADYDLCLSCLLNDSHGHHPGHAFSLVDNDRQFSLKGMVMLRCSPGRHYQHAAICDGCDKRIIGVRHKCLTCPDWDYCSECLKGAHASHPSHRFVPIYGSMAEPALRQEVHYGIFCDGALCKGQIAPSYISGVRYKCAVCHDTDFCAKCEASPNNVHNHTHPLIKFKTPVRRVTVSTANEDAPNGQVITLGDRVQKSTSTQANHSLSSETLTPATAPTSEPAENEKTQEDGNAGKAAELQDSVPSVRATTARVVPVQDPVADYQAFFVRDTVPDGTVLGPSQIFRQTWTLYNPGPMAWPAGTDVRFVAGDTMFNVDTTRPSSLQSVSSAMESNKLSAPLEPGQSAEFTVLLRSPNHTGSAISYWRLKLSNGVPFGHRLWCAIDVGDVPDQPAQKSDEPEEPKESKEPEQEPAQEETEMTQSRMIFPTLDKESPVASTHEAESTPAITHPEPSAPSVSNYTDQDYLTITDTMSTEDDETRDGFLTDEEYDVLDASDQEYLEAKQAQ